jgi:thioester reductase-like protein
VLTDVLEKLLDDHFAERPQERNTPLTAIFATAPQHVTSFAERLGQEFDIPEPAVFLARANSTAGLIAAIEEFYGAVMSQPSRDSAFDWDRECILPDEIRPLAELPEPRSPAANAFLTGATGFLGAFLLSEILKQTSQSVTCLVRCVDAEHGEARIRDTLARYLLWDDNFAQRIHAVPGSLSQSRFGLSDSDYGRLTETTDVIYHNGAWLNLQYPYGVLKPSNVQGTIEALRLAVTGVGKTVHFVSSLGVLDGWHSLQNVDENTLPAPIHEYGYLQSKAVAEMLVREAGNRGVPITIHRPGLINACSQTGAYTTRDLASQLLRLWAATGTAPRLEGRMLVTPVDFVSRGIVSLCNDPASRGRTFHFVNPSPLAFNDFYELLRQAGFPVRELSYTDWRENVLRLAVDADYTYREVLPFLPAPDPPHRMEPMRLWPPKNLHFDCQETLSSLANRGVFCPEPKGVWFDRCCNYFRSRGLL